MTAKDFTFYTKAEYYADLIARMDKLRAGDRIALATMALDPGELGVQPVLDALGAAAERGAEASLLVDAYIFLSEKKRGPGPLFFRTTLPKRMLPIFQRKFDLLEALRVKGVRYTLTNIPERPFTSPVAGRSHIKFAIINDRLYVGGCNLNTEEDIDLMVGWNDKRTADWLYDFAGKVHEHRQVRKALNNTDTTYIVAPGVQLFIDAGVQRQSTILQEALKFIDQAHKELLITCQFFPNSITTEHIAAAHHRGVKATIVYNRASKHEFPFNVLHYLVDARERMRTPIVLFSGRLARRHHYLHAKLIATEKGAIIGSHNFVAAGVNFGTAEIALASDDPAFARKATEALQRQYQEVTPTSPAAAER